MELGTGFRVTVIFDMFFSSMAVSLFISILLYFISTLFPVPLCEFLS